MDRSRDKGVRCGYEPRSLEYICTQMRVLGVLARDKSACTRANLNSSQVILEKAIRIIKTFRLMGSIYTCDFRKFNLNLTLQKLNIINVND